MTAILFPDSVQRCLDSLPAHGSVVSWFESQTETMDTLHPQKSTAKQACDNCRRRKIKCDREYPCDKCRRLLLSCSYTDILQRKGPKLRHLYPLARVYPPSSTFPSVCETTTSSSSSQAGLDQIYDPQSASTSVPHWHGIYESQSSPDSGTSRSQCESSSPRATANWQNGTRRLSPPFILAHINVFMKYLYPVMPVILPDQIIEDCNRLETLPPQRYAFIAALCGATHFQLNLDGQGDGHNPASGCCIMAGEEILAEAIAARKEFDMFVNPNLDTLLTSFFLFASYAHLDHQDHAYFYLSQCTAIVHTLGLHRESTYTLYEPAEAEERRRVFWFLFITERSYALQHAKPVMLRSSIHKPKVLLTEDPVSGYCFLNLINLYESMTVDLYDWASAGCDNTFFKAASANSTQGNIAVPVTLVTSLSEIQHFNILITQRWLQAIVWKISINQNKQPKRIETRLPFHLPFLIARKILDVVSIVSQSAAEAHGIGMEQKLHDMGSFLPEVNFALNPPTTLEVVTDTMADSKDLLWGNLNILAKIRTTQSYLIPILLQQSGGLFHWAGTPSVQTSPTDNAATNELTWTQGPPIRQVSHIPNESPPSHIQQRQRSASASHVQGGQRRGPSQAYRQEEGSGPQMYMSYPE